MALNGQVTLAARFCMAFFFFCQTYNAGVKDTVR